MTTALQIIDAAYLYLGYKDANEPLNASDSQYGLTKLNDLVDSWNADNLYLFSVQEVVAVVSGNPVSIGPGQSIDVPRQTTIPDGAFFRVNGADFQVIQIDRQAYAQIPVKGFDSQIPFAMYYDAGDETGNLFFYPAPTPGSELHLPISQQLAAFADLATDYALPAGYRRALEMTLTEELSPGIKTIDDRFARRAAAARRNLRKLNFEVPRMDATEGCGYGSAQVNFIAGV